SRLLEFVRFFWDTTRHADRLSGRCGTTWTEVSGLRRADGSISALAGSNDSQGDYGISGSPSTSSSTSSKASSVMFSSGSV
ncbi:uncharacterized, partial [Tachysurus ichikawai]